MKLSIPNLALFRHSMMLESRQTITYVYRFLLLCVLFVCVWIFHLSYRRFTLQMSAVGKQFFMSITYINLICLTIAGIGFFSSAITEEKEEKMLGFLLMTGLSPFTMLVSKFTSRYLGGVFLLLVQVPFTMLAITFGGIGITQIFTVYITLLAYTFLLCGIAIFCSVVAKNSRSASALMIFFLSLFYMLHLFFSLIMSLIWMVLTSELNALEDGMFYFAGWSLMSPFVRAQEIFSTGFNGKMLGIQVYSNMLIGVVFFVFAWLLFNRFSRKEIETTSTKRGGFTRISKIKLIRVGRVWNLPISWKEFYFNGGGKFGLIGRGVIYCALLIFAFVISYWDRWGRQDCLEQVGAFAMGTGLFLLPIEISFFAATIFSSEIRNKTYSGVAILPYSIAYLCYMKIIGILPLLIPVSIYIIFGLSCVQELDITEVIDEVGFWFYICGLMFFFHLVACLSLYIRYGAFFVAILFCIVFMFIYTFISQLIFGYNGDVSIGVLCVLAIGGAIGLHLQIGKKLRTLAGSL